MTDSGLAASVTIECKRGQPAEIHATGQDDFRIFLEKAPGPRKSLEAIMQSPIMAVEVEDDALIFIFNTTEPPSEAKRQQLCRWLQECEEHYDLKYRQEGTTYRAACEAARSTVIVRPTVALATHSVKREH